MNDLLAFFAWPISSIVGCLLRALPKIGGYAELHAEVRIGQRPRQRKRSAN